jgi:branched-subunit amino acid transport protein AzlD
MHGSKLVLVILLMSAITFAARALPFVFFKKRKPPRVLAMIEAQIPPAIMVILVFFSVKDADLLVYPYGLPHAAGIVLVIVLQLWRRNAMLSIIAGTACYMTLIRLL